MTPADPSATLDHLADVARRAREEGEHDLEVMAADLLAEARDPIRRGAVLRKVRRWRDVGFAEVMRREGVAKCG
jgi:hypothetical protein